MCLECLGVMEQVRSDYWCKGFGGKVTSLFALEVREGCLDRSVLGVLALDIAVYAGNFLAGVSV